MHLESSLLAGLLRVGTVHLTNFNTGKYKCSLLVNSELTLTAEGSVLQDVIDDVTKQALSHGFSDVVISNEDLFSVKGLPSMPKEQTLELRKVIKW